MGRFARWSVAICDFEAKSFTVKYKCSKCGEEHEGWPALTFKAPQQYQDLSEEEKSHIATLSDDFCVIRYSDQVDRFIRVVMFQNVLDHCQTLDYGVWVSVSEKTYNEYYDNFDSGEHEGTYFGFLYNIPGYEQVLSLKTNVVIAKGTQRPEAIPHRSQLGSQFVTDYYEGISKEAAERRIRKFLEDHGLVLP